MVLSTFNKELYEKNLKEDAYSEGQDARIAEGTYETICDLIKINFTKAKNEKEIAEELEKI